MSSKQLEFPQDVEHMVEVECRDTGNTDPEKRWAYFAVCACNWESEEFVGRGWPPMDLARAAGDEHFNEQQGVRTIHGWELICPKCDSTYIADKSTDEHYECE